MDIAYYISAGFLAAGIIPAAIMKLATPKDRLYSRGQTWTKEYSQRAIWGVGVAEAAAVVGLFAAPLTGIVPLLGPIAAVGLIVVQALAMRMHSRRGEMIIPNVMLAGTAACTAILGFLAFA